MLPRRQHDRICVIALFLCSLRSAFRFSSPWDLRARRRRPPRPPDGLLQNAALSLYQTFSQFDLVAVPLYILVGTLMERARLSEKLFAFARVWFGQLRGGLGVATIAACAMFAAISGSSVATAATIGVVAMPALNRGGYRPEFSGGMIAAGGTLGILIPPRSP